MLCTLKLKKGFVSSFSNYWYPFVVLVDKRGHSFFAKKAKVRLLDSVDLQLGKEFNAEVAVENEYQIHCGKTYFVFDLTVSGTLTPYLKRDD
jgi:hypothetical protein